MVSPPEPKAAEASSGQPAETLQPDPVDGPAPTSVRDARRSAEMSREMAPGGHAMQHGATAYRQLDAGRDSVTTPSEEGGAAHEHGMQKSSPPPAPTQPPGMKKPPPDVQKPSPEPTHPPHHSGRSEEDWRDGEAVR
ncbi:MAG: hypothetical protein ABR576_15760 [Thermoanaerobaculia bacterium]